MESSRQMILQKTKNQANPFEINDETMDYDEEAQERTITPDLDNEEDAFEVNEDEMEELNETRTDAKSSRRVIFYKFLK